MQINKYPKVLIISNNAFSRTNNMGKALSEFFRDFPSSHLAQLYFHGGKPTSNVCNNYYSFSDKDALKSILFRWNKGRKYKDEDFSSYNHKYFNSLVYRVGKQKHPIVLFARDLIWKLSNVLNEKLLLWIEDFNPDVIFFASGDYSFSYRIALNISKKLAIPLTTCCFDDYYTNCVYSNKLFGKQYFNRFLKNSKLTIDYSKTLFVVSEKMKEQYDLMFLKKSIVLYIPTQMNFSPETNKERKGVCYLGGLGLGRSDSLIRLGKELIKYSKQIDGPIRVYSPVSDPAIIEKLNLGNGLQFMGSVDGNEVKTIISSSKAVIHVESFLSDSIKRTKLSISTKISDSLGSGTLLLAFGPSELASMEYLHKYNAAVVSNEPREIANMLIECLNDNNKYYFFINNALALAKQNHSNESVTNNLVSGLTIK